MSTDPYGIADLPAELAHDLRNQRKLFGEDFIPAWLKLEDEDNEEVASESQPSAAPVASTQKPASNKSVLKSYDDSALGDAFVAAYPELIWNSTKQVWMRYEATKGIWQIYNSNSAELLIDTFLKGLQVAAEASSDKNAKIGAKRCGDQRTQESVAKKIKTKRHVEQHLFDADPYRRVFANGVFDPRKPGVMEPFSQALYSTRCVPLDYKPKAKHERLADVLKPLPDDAHSWYQLMAGQSMLGFQPAAEFAIFLFGPTASNGKSLLFDLMESTLGKYEEGSTVHCGYFGRPSEATLQAGEAYDLVSYEGLSQAGIEEMPDKMIHSSPFKRLIGTEGFKGRQIFEKNRMIHNRATLWITANILPAFDSSDQGVIRRIKVLPFEKKYVDTQAQLAAYPAGVAYLKDPSLKKMAQSDTDLQEAFLAWRMEGAIRWCATPEAQRASLEGTVPGSVQRATDRWLNREDTIQGWMLDSVAFDPLHNAEGEPLAPQSYCLTTDLFESYTAWMKANGHAFTVKLNTFMDRFDQNAKVQAHRLERVRGRVGQLTHSKLEKADGETSRPGTTPNHVKGLRFRTELDDYEIEPVSTSLTAEEAKRLMILDLLSQAKAAGISLQDLAAFEVETAEPELIEEVAPTNTTDEDDEESSLFDDEDFFS